MSLKKLQAKRTGGGGDRTPTENVAIKVVSYHVGDRREPNVDKDYFVGVLMHNALGMVAEFDENNNPITEVKVRLRADPQQGKRKHSRAEIAHLESGDKRQKVFPGGIVQADRSFIDRDGFVNTAWIRGLVRREQDLQEGNAMVLAGVMTSVQPERKSKDGQSFQYRFITDPYGAMKVSGVDELRGALTAALQDNEWGPTGFILRGIDTENVEERASVRWTRRWDSEAKALTSPEATVEEFFEKNEAWVQHIAEASADSTEIFEVIPIIRVRTGRDSLPSMKYDGKGGRDEAESYRFVTQDEDGKPRTSYGWAISTMTLLRGEGENKSWFATMTNPTSRGAVIFDDAELVTPTNLPEHTATALEQVATARRSAPEQRNTQDEDQQFGEEPSGPNP